MISILLTFVPDMNRLHVIMIFPKKITYRITRCVINEEQDKLEFFQSLTDRPKDKKKGPET